MNPDLLNTLIALVVIVSVAGCLATFAVLMDLVGERWVQRVERSMRSEQRR